METLQDWFVKQGIANLWTNDVEESEEILLLLASEKQWNDVNEICENDLKIPKIKIAYLKAYLIKRTKQETNDNTEENNKINKKKMDEMDEMNENQNKNDICIPDIKEAEYKTNYTMNGFKYKNIAIIKCDNNEYIKYFDDNKPFIMHGLHSDNILNEIHNNLCTVRVSNSRDFRTCNMSENYGKYKLKKKKDEKISEMSINEFMNNIITQTNDRKYYYLETRLNNLNGLEIYSNIFKQCKYNSLVSNCLHISNKGCIIPLQYKQTNNLFISINGYTEIILFNPITTPYLYSFPYGHPFYKQAMVNCEYLKNNPIIFKKFKNTNSILNDNIYRCLLSKGDVLYIPYNWWYEITNLNDFTINIMFQSKPLSIVPINITNDKTIQQKIKIGQNLERIVFTKYGSKQNITNEIFKSFLNGNETYTKHRNDIKKLLKNVFDESEIKEFISELVDGRYNVDFNQFI